MLAAALISLLLLSFSNNSPLPAAAAASVTADERLRFHEAPQFYNSPGCPPPLLPGGHSDVCPVSALAHVAMTLDADYLRGTVAAVHSILRHAACPQSIHFHFIAAAETEPSPSPSPSSNIDSLASTVASAFPALSFAIHPFDPSTISYLISPALRAALDRPLNYARIRLPDILPSTCSPPRLVYLDSDVVLVDDIHRLASTPFPDDDAVIAAPEHCRANLSSYFTQAFWSDPALAGTFSTRPRRPCYFNTGVMVIDLGRWRAGGYTERLERWMRLQRRQRIYELGSLPPFLLEFAGRVAPVGQRWNQHGLGGDNKKGLCRRIHPGPVSLLHWSGKGKPWVRIDARRPCPVDELWAPYDLVVRTPDSTPVSGDEDI